MEKMFKPRSIAFVGASNSLAKWGGIVFRNLVSAKYEGRVYPINSREGTIQGYKAYPTVRHIPGEVDLAIFTVPANAILEAVSSCVDKRIPAGIVITAGFAELGEEGRLLQDEMVRRARAGNMLLVGPNGQGIAVPGSRLYPWIPMFRPDPGPVGIASQSGNVATVFSEQLAEFGFGCSKVISVGNCADLGWPEYLEYFRHDHETKVVLLYIEGITQGQEFFAAAKRTSLQKPVVMFKSGRTEAGTRAASSHTGVLAGAEDIFSAACRQAGLIRVYTLEEAVIMAATLAGSTPLPRGRRVGIITGGGGHGVIAADASVELGLDLVRFSEKTINRLRSHLPAWWSPNNPVDMVAGLGFGGPRELIPIVMESGEVDGVILLGIGWVYSMMDAINRPTDFRDIKDELLRAHIDNDVRYCETLAEYTRAWGKPLVMSSPVARLAIRRSYPGLMRIMEQGIMLYPTIEDALRAMSALIGRYEFLARHGAAD